MATLSSPSSLAHLPRGGAPIELGLETSPASIPQGEWSELIAGRSFYLSLPWLRAAAAYEGAVFGPVLTLRQGGRLVGALPCQLLERGARSPRYNLFDLFGAPSGLPTSAGEGWSPQLVGGPLGGYANALLLAPGLEPSLRAAACVKLADAFLDLARDSGAGSAAVPYLDRDDAAELGGQFPDSVQLLTSAAARLALPGPAFEDYLRRSLPKRRRNNVKHDLADFSGCGCRTRRTRLVEIMDQAVPLLANVNGRHEGSACRAGDYLEACTDADLEPYEVTLAAECEGRLVAFSLNYTTGKELTTRSVGIDYDHPCSRASYFSVLFYEPIRYAGEAGLERIDFGTLAYQAKLLRGARLHPLWSLLWLRDRETGAQLRRGRDEWNQRQRDRLAEEARPVAELEGPGWS